MIQCYVCILADRVQKRAAGREIMFKGTIDSHNVA